MTGQEKTNNLQILDCMESNLYGDKNEGILNDDGHKFHLMEIKEPLTDHTSPLCAFSPPFFDVLKSGAVVKDAVTLDKAKQWLDKQLNAQLSIYNKRGAL
jgi:hypothetical protein